MSKPSFAGRTLISGFTRLNRTRPWYRLPFLLGLLNLIALRDQLREDNLVDTRTPGEHPPPRSHGRPRPQRSVASARPTARTTICPIRTWARRARASPATCRSKNAFPESDAGADGAEPA